MSEEKKDKNETTTEVIEEEIIEEEVDEKTQTQIENIIKIDELVRELDRINHKGGPDIRICPKCFSLRIKVIDLLKDMGISTGYPTCVCQDCGWRSNKWIYLDRTMSKEERENFILDAAKEEASS